MAVVLAGGAVCYQRALRPVEVEVASVEQTVDVREFGIGTVEAQILSHVGFQISGKIAMVEAGPRLAASAWDSKACPMPCR